ncbi:hypothetical protein [Pelagibacterium montanilacus]|uniref:hypothetical protein n=1 Tax=Pelagibacterium montanilacus TaxID=2185280 RepID=UPI000F8E8940|nr:hypothetical protein [Pelagibacterium montanilacus]
MENNRTLDIYGTAQAPAPLRRLTAGPLEIEIGQGVVRSVRWAGVEVLRGIDYPVRDVNWGRFGAASTDEAFEEAPDRFSYRRTFRTGEGALDGVFSCRGNARGELDVDVSLSAQAGLEVNRAGFVLLHPVAGVAGSALEVVHSDGRREHTRFPQALSPSQPVFDIVAMTHTVAGARIAIDLEGEVFEMEDQRNWSDASFKTYCRPLSLPRPYHVAAGASIRQSISIRVSGPGSGAQAGDGHGIAPGEVTGSKVPELALALEPGWEDGSGLVAALEPASLLIRMDLRGADWPDQVPVLLREASGAAIDLELVVPDDLAAIDRGLSHLAGTLARASVAPRSVIALPGAYLKSFQPTDAWPAGATPGEAAASARRHFPRAAIGGGMLTNFTELNRCPGAARAGDFLSHGTTAIVHAADDLSVVQTLEALPQIFASAQALAPDRPYRLGLVSIGMRSNPYGAAIADNPERVRCAMAMDDPRQHGLFAAAWMVGALAATEASTVERMALGSPGGPFALVAKGKPLPVYHAFAGLQRLQGHERIAMKAPSWGAAVAAASGSATGVVLANLSADTHTLALPEGARFVVLDTPQGDRDWLATAERRRGPHLVLEPYALAFIALGEFDIFSDGP